jgi:hypothetical protein
MVSRRANRVGTDDWIFFSLFWLLVFGATACSPRQNFFEKTPLQKKGRLSNQKAWEEKRFLVRTIHEPLTN